MSLDNKFGYEFAGDVQTKNEFLKFLADESTGMEDRSVEQTAISLRNMAYLENIFGKDIYDFTDKETNALLGALNKPSIASLAAEKSIIENYIAYAISKHKTKQDAHAIFTLKRGHLKQFINQTALTERYPTKKEFFHHLDEIDSYQSKAIWLLAWLGFYDKKYHAIKNLRTEDIDFINNTLSTNVNYEVTNDAGNRIDEEYLRTVTLDVHEADILNKASQEEGMNTDTANDKYKFEYKDTPYLLKVTSKTKNSDTLTIGVLMSRIKNTGKPFWTIKTVYVAGIMNRMLEIKDKWTNKEVNDYLKENYYNLSSTIIIDILDVYKSKVEKEKELHFKECAATNALS